MPRRAAAKNRPPARPARDEAWMRLALEEARKGIGRTGPNPAVGAVIVRGKELLSRGWHRGAGNPHAEIEALRALADPAMARGAEMFVTLEPCSTHGRTPPCTEALISAGLARVVIGAIDPNPAHSGIGLRILSRAGIQVAAGVLDRECREINRAWNKWIATGLPWVILKCGMSLDGRITAPPPARLITGPASRLDAMRLRSQVDAILIGGETLRTDNPRLTVRGISGRETPARQPLRVVWTRNPRNLPADARLFRDRFHHLTLVRSDSSLRALLRALGKRGVTSVLIEGGGKVLGAAVDARLADELVFYRAPVLFGGGAPAVRGRGVPSPSHAIRLENLRWESLGPDLKMTGTVRR